MAPRLTPAMIRALAKAAERPRANICPIAGVHAAAEDALVDALDRRGMIAWDGGAPNRGAPRISDAGRTALAQARQDPA